MLCKRRGEAAALRNTLEGTSVRYSSGTFSQGVRSSLHGLPFTFHDAARMRRLVIVMVAGQYAAPTAWAGAVHGKAASGDGRRARQPAREATGYGASQHPCSSMQQGTRL